jgi:FkbM family methyltransferase
MSAAKAQVFGFDVTVTCHNGAAYFVPEYGQNRPVARRALRGRHAEPRLHKFVGTYFEDVRGSMVHAGTFFGDMLPSFSRKVPGRLYAFEPVLENYLMAWSSVAANSLGNVLLFHAGLGSEVGSATVETLRPSGRHMGGSSNLETDAQQGDSTTEQVVPMINLDALAIDDLAMVQLDVEGFELSVLHGATATIERCRPVVVLEDNKENCQPYLRELGYERAGTLARVNTVYIPSGTQLSSELLGILG